jgi:hypothetical protein
MKWSSKVELEQLDIYFVQLAGQRFCLFIVVVEVAGMGRLIESFQWCAVDVPQSTQFGEVLFQGGTIQDLLHVGNQLTIYVGCPPPGMSSHFLMLVPADFGTCTKIHRCTSEILSGLVK